jgi:two-component system chemotaxis response regulator CheB
MPAKVIVTASAAASLDPLRRVLSELPADLDAAVLVVQHRAATAGTLLAGMLRAVTPLRVVSVEHAHALEGATVHVLPPDRRPTLLEDGTIDVATLSGTRGRTSLELMVESALEMYGPDTIGLQLAGDCGWTPQVLDAIRAAGGVVVTQEDAVHAKPARSARVDPSMLTDVLPVSEISYRLWRLVATGATRQLPTGVS